MTYTLQDYYQDAGVSQDTQWASSINLRRKEPSGAWVELIPDTHQKTGLNRALSCSRFGLYDVCDTGKTLPMQAYSILYAVNGYRVVAVMLPVLVQQFAEKLSETFEGIAEHVSWHALTETPAKRDKLFATWKETKTPGILLMSYEMFIKEWRRLLEFDFRVLVADEADRLCNCETLAHKAVKQFAEEVDLMEECAMLLSTGTPVRKELIDAYGLISLVTPGIYVSKGQFERLHVEYFQKGQGERKEILTYNDTDLLHRNLYCQSRRVTKDQIGRLEIPRVTELPVELEPAHRALYRRLLKERILEIDGTIVDAINASALRQLALQLITTPHRYVDKGVSIRNACLDALEAYANAINVEHEEKLIVVCYYNATIEHLKEHFKHLQPADVYGGTKDPQKQLKRFKEDPKCRLLLGNAGSMAAGVDGLQFVCSKAVVYEPMSVPRTFTQFLERINRRGQRFQVCLQILRVLRTISPKLTDMMLERNVPIKQVNRDKFSFLDELCGEVETSTAAPF